MLLALVLSFTQSSVSIKEYESPNAQKRGFTLRHILIAIDGIAFYVHQITTSDLSSIQIRDIFTGRITNKEKNRWF